MKPKVEIDEYGNKRWRLNDKLHREDGPAVECASGTKKWYIAGKMHRVGGPAVEDSGGSKTWWFNGKLHRVDGPAVELANGHKEWWLAGKCLIKEEWFNSLSAEDKEKLLFSEHFITG